MSTLDPLPPDAASCFVGPVYQWLLDHALACNEAALLVQGAHLLEQTASNGVDRINQLNACVVTTRQAKLFDSAALCALSYVDQTIGVYAATATAFAVAAVSVLAAAAAGQTPDIRHGKDPLPSEVLDAPDVYFPLIAIPAVRGSRGDMITDQNAQLRDAHADLMATVGDARKRLPLHVFDDPATLAARPAAAVDLSSEMPAAMHKFGSVCAWAAALAAKP